MPKDKRRRGESDKKINFKKCIICKNTVCMLGRTFHRFPINAERKKIWCSLLNLDENTNGYICSDHFRGDDFVSYRNGVKQLKFGANPIVVPFYEANDSSSSGRSDKEKASSEETLTASEDETYQHEFYKDVATVPEEEIDFRSRSNMEEFKDGAKTFFSTEGWKSLTEQEQHKYAKIYYIYMACVDLGINVVKPTFMDIPFVMEEDVNTEKNVSEAYSENIQANVKSHNKVLDEHKYCKARTPPGMPLKGRYQCSKCPFATEIRRQFTRHEATHTNEKKFVCNICNQAYKENQSLVVHMKSVHSTEKPLQCSKCDFTSYWLRSLVKHQKTHEFKSVCDECNEGFTNKRDYYVHMKQHAGNSVVMCPECDKPFLNKFTLRCHIKGVHDKEMVSCALCSYKTSRRKDLTKHMYIHMEKAPFKCDICEYRTCRKHLLKEHARRYHPQQVT